jgi:hypothetical protein
MPVVGLVVAQAYEKEQIGLVGWLVGWLFG